jgi:hypothetical protein
VPPRIVQTIIPDEAVFRCQTTARAEGKKEKGGLRVAVPAPVVRGLTHLGWGGKWLHVRLKNARWIAAVRPHPTATMFALPKWCRGDVVTGDEIELELFDAEHVRCQCRGLLDEKQKRIDWTAVVPDDAFPIEESNDVLAVHTRYAPPFRLRRFAELSTAQTFLGMYPGDARAKTWQIMCHDWSRIEAVVTVLDALGIPRERIVIRQRGDAWALRVEASRPFVQMTTGLRAAFRIREKRETANILESSP